MKRFNRLIQKAIFNVLMIMNIKIEWYQKILALSPLRLLMISGFCTKYSNLFLSLLSLSLSLMVRSFP